MNSRETESGLMFIRRVAELPHVASLCGIFRAL